MKAEDIKWLKETFPKYRNAVMRGVNVEAYGKAEELMIGKRSTPNCSCSYNAYQIKINGYHDKWLKENM